MKTFKDKAKTVMAGGAVGLGAIGYLILLFAFIFLLAAVFNFFPATAAYLIVNYAPLGLDFTYWQVYWVTYLIVFVFGIRFNTSK